jgi:phosphatidate phosphatase LPIN
MFGKDWSHKGVVKLYNDIFDNGYKILYLTARALCQSDQTKNYLNKLQQGNLIKL